MEFFLQENKSVRLLLLSDVNMANVTTLSERLVPLTPQFDGIIVTGPFGLDRFKTAEETAMALGDMASTLAQLENIVCRVIYLPTESEPDRALREQLHLTPNSVNIHGRRLDVLNGVHIIGFAERNEQSVCSKVSRAALTEDELDEPESLEIVSSSVDIIGKLLSAGEEKRLLDPDGIDDDYVATTVNNSNTVAAKHSLGIFSLHYQYAHTLNYVLFGLDEKKHAANIKLCIIASSNDEEISRLPTQLLAMTVAPVRSLSRGYFTSLQLCKEDNGGWNIGKIEVHKLDI